VEKFFDFLDLLLPLPLVHVGSVSFDETEEVVKTLAFFATSRGDPRQVLRDGFRAGLSKLRKRLHPLGRIFSDVRTIVKAVKVAQCFNRIHFNRFVVLGHLNYLLAASNPPRWNRMASSRVSK